MSRVDHVPLKQLTEPFSGTVQEANLSEYVQQKIAINFPTARNEELSWIHNCEKPLMNEVPEWWRSSKYPNCGSVPTNGELD